MIDKSVAKNILINNIKRVIPNYKFNNLTNTIIDYAFETGPDLYKETEVVEFITSLTLKIATKNTTGHLTPFEQRIYFCNDKTMHPYKHTADMGCAEYWTSLIMNWNFSKAKGCDLDDEDGLGVDMKAVTTSIGKIPCTFYSSDGIPIKKKFIDNKKCIYYNNELYWREGESFRGMYDAIRLIKSCQIEYQNLNRYIFYKFDQLKNRLTSIVKSKQAVENNINKQLVNLNDKKIDLTHSKWEDGAYIYTFEEFGAIE